jgi:hypothetical protein
MFFDELTPLLKEFAKEPVAFASGFVSGVLRLNLSDDPVKSWLEKQAGFTPTNTNTDRDNNDRTPQSIEID